MQMDKDIKKALDDAEKRLERSLDKIEERHQAGVKNSNREPDVLKSGSFDEVGLKRAEKEQERRPSNHIDKVVEAAKSSAKQIFKEKPEDIKEELEKETTMGNSKNLVKPDNKDE